MTRPPARPEGALIRLARQAAGLSIPDAVRLSGVSKARWSTVESGSESRDGVTRPVNAKADTIARMARAVGINPDRLESEGQRADAALILREILRAEAEPPASPAAEDDGPLLDDEDPGALALEVARLLIDQLPPGRARSRAEEVMQLPTPRLYSAREILELLQAVLEAPLRPRRQAEGDAAALPERPHKAGLAVIPWS
jgi:transcriptional regulator with XRE-family HTH domain